MSPTDLRTFPYNTGSRDVMGDPFRIMRELTVLLEGDPKSVLEEAGLPTPPPTGDPEADQVIADATKVRKARAQHRLADAARSAFDMDPYDRDTGRGPLDDECLDVLYAFIEWVKKKGRTGGSRPNSVTPSVPPGFLAPGLSPPTPQSASSSTTSDCGCG